MQITSQALPYAADCFFKECWSLKFYPITILKKNCVSWLYTKIRDRPIKSQFQVLRPKRQIQHTARTPILALYPHFFSMNLLSSVLTKANLASIFLDSSLSSHFRKCNPQFSKTRVLPRILCTLTQNTVFSTHWDISGNFLFNIRTWWVVYKGIPPSPIEHKRP